MVLFYSFFKTLVNKNVTIHLKNEITIRGKLHSVDQYLNVKLKKIEVLQSDMPYLGCVNNVFIRGSSIRYIELVKGDVDLELMEDATRREWKRVAEQVK